MRASKLRQQALFAKGFNAFGQGFNLKPFRHADNRRDHTLLFGVFIGAHATNERSILMRSTLKRRMLDKRRVTGPKIIQINAKTLICPIREYCV